MLGEMEYGANQNALKNLLGALYKLINGKKYGEDEPMSDKDMGDVMEDAKSEAMDDMGMEESPIQKEARDFMKSNNRGNIPKATATMIKVSAKKAPKNNPMPKKKGKGKKGKGKSLFGKY